MIDFLNMALKYDNVPMNRKYHSIIFENIDYFIFDLALSVFYRSEWIYRLQISTFPVGWSISCECAHS
jgi:hypothetical protein